jgi:hypothetical protein
VEEVLGVPLLPQTPYEIVADPDRPDIRVTVHNLVVHAVQSVVRRKIWEPGDGAYLSPSQRAKVEEGSQELLVHARRHVIIANNVAETIGEPAFVPPGAEPSDSPRSLLQGMMGMTLFNFVQRPHPPKAELGGATGPLAALRSGLLLASAMSTGKTVPVAELARRAGVGRAFADIDPEQNKLLVVVPGIELLDTYADPDETLRRWLPGLEVSEYSHRRKQVGGGIQLITDDSLPRAVASGALDLSEHPIRVIDEGQHAAAPTMLRELGGMSAGRLIVCTGTPNRIRKYFTNFTASTPRSAAEQGITRPVELITYQYGAGKGAAEKLTAQIAAGIIKSGRQVGIYCRALRGAPGAKQARDIAEILNGLGLEVPEGLGWEGGDVVRVIAGVSGAEENARAKADHKSGAIRGYAAIRMLTEGVNMPLDAVIVLGPRDSQDEVDQIVGRLRPIFSGNGRFEVGVVIEVQPRAIRPGRPLASPWKTYGFTDNDDITQGFRIGPSEEKGWEYEEGFDPVPDAEPPTNLDSEPGAGGVAPGAESSEAEADETGGQREPTTKPHRVRPPIVDELNLGDLDEFLALPAPLRTITIAPQDWSKYETPAEGSQLLAALAAKYNVPEIWLRRKLDIWSADPELNISYVGVRSMEITTEGGRGEYERWYGPETVAYLEANPPVGLADTERMDIADIVEMCGVSRRYIEDIIDRLSLPNEPLLGKSHRPTKHYRMPEIKKIVMEVDKIPVANPELEEALSDLSQETNESFVYNFVRARKNNVTVNERRRHPSSGIRGFAFHVDKGVAARMRDAFYNPPLATEIDISVAEMARRAGMTLGGMIGRIERIPDAERPDIRPLKLGAKAKGRMADHMNRAEGLAIVEMARPRKLTPDRVTIALMDKYFLSNRKTIVSRITTLVEQAVITPEQGKVVLINLSGQGGETATWQWSVLQAVENHTDLQVREGVERVDYDLTARGPFDPSWQYSQEMQRRFINPDKLIKLPGRDKLLRIGVTHKVSGHTMELSAYSASRNVREEEVVQAVAEDAIQGALLYYRDSDVPGNPIYVIDGPDIERFDRYFRPATETIAEQPARKPEARPPAEKPDAAVAAPPATFQAPAAQQETLRAPEKAGAAAVAAEPTGEALEWLTPAGAMQELRCSGAALIFLVASVPGHKQYLRRDDNGMIQFNAELIGRIRSHTKRAPSVEYGWIRHERLAQQIGIEPQHLRAYIDKRGIALSPSDARVARVQGTTTSDIDFDLAYAPRVRRLVMQAASNQR